MATMEMIYPLILDAFSNNLNFSFPINGTSMQPLLHKDNVVTLSKIDTVKKGDIILFKRDNGQFVLHRLNKIKKDEYIFVGDHQTKLEYGVRFDQLIGKVICYRKNNKTYQLKGFKYFLYKNLIKYKSFRKILLFLKF